MLRSAMVIAVVGVLGSGAAAAESEAGASAGSSARPRVVVLVSVRSSTGTVTSFGSTGIDEIPARMAIASALVARGFDVVSAAQQRVELVATRDEPSAVVLSDDSAADLARRLGAGAAVIVGLQASTEGPIRGTPQRGSIAGGQARLLRVADSKVLAEKEARGAGHGIDDAAADHSAVRDALADLSASMTLAASTAWPPPLQTSGDRMKVKIRGARTWGPVSMIIRRLATTKGITAVHPREAGGGSVTLGVETTLATAAVVTAIRGTRLLSGTLSASQQDGTIDVVVRGD